MRKVQIGSSIWTNFASFPILIYIYQLYFTPPTPPYFDSDCQLRAGEGQILARLHGCMQQKRIGIIFPLKSGDSFASSDEQLKLGL